MPIPIYKTLTKEQITHLVSSSKTWKELAYRMGYGSISGDSLKILRNYVSNTLLIDTSHFIVRGNATARTKENIFVENSTADQSTLRKWYLLENPNYICSICGQEPIWNGKALTLILDHINGKNKDDRLSNLRWVCPNCNMQLPTTNRSKPIQKQLSYCIDCGRAITKYAQRCKSCEAYNRYK